MEANSYGGQEGVTSLSQTVLLSQSQRVTGYQTAPASR